MKNKFILVESSIKGDKGRILELKDVEEEESEFISMMEFNNNEHPEEVKTVFFQLRTMVKKWGFLDASFLLEHKPKYKIFRILKTKNLRVYCIKYNQCLIVLAGGGSKFTAKIQDDPNLMYQRNMLEQISILIDDRIKSGKIVIDGKNISGELTFEIETD